MRILFICGSLAPGKDGVGDYTRLLASELAASGQEPVVFGWMDAHTDRYQDAREEVRGQSLRCIRLPREARWKQRFSCLGTLLNQFQPDCVSLQYVPWTYGRFGASGKPARLLRQLLPSRACRQIMFHELWIGGNPQDPPRERLIGALQKRSILKLVRAVRPQVCHSSNPAYLRRLEAEGIPARLLPLFGNIPVAPPDAEGSLGRIAARSQGAFRPEDRKAWLLSAVFGTVHPQWTPHPAIESCLARLEAEAGGRRLALLFLGRGGRQAEPLRDSLVSRFGDSLLCLDLGEMDPAGLSALFQELDFGFAASPIGLAGKSGSAVAMMEHGLPVLFTRFDVAAPPAETPACYLAARARRFEASDFDWSAFLAERTAPGPVLPAVAERFLSDLERRPQ